MTTPAGWYPSAHDGPGAERYWDGNAWTPQVRQASGPGVVGPPGAPTPAQWVQPGGPPKQGNWFGRHKILTAIGAILVLIIAVGVSSGGGNKANTSATDPLTTQTTQPQATESTTEPAAVVPAGPTKPNDKGWVVQGLLTKDDGVGDFGGTARITNTNSDTTTATFTFTLARGGKQIATLQGSANAVSAGKTVTVDLISQDKYSTGTYTYDFQTDVSY